MIMLKPPATRELDALPELCTISKTHWEYNEAFMETCREELTISGEEGLLP